jgi:hypothetical protein
MTSPISVGKIITFYSFKGGVGRTMALSNVAALLSKWGKKVLVVDFDLEAPGVEKYFTDFTFSKTREQCSGLVDMLFSISSDAPKIDWQNCIIEITSRQYNLGCHILPAGKENTEYASKLQDLNWDFLFEKKNLAEKFEEIRKEWKETYDYILVDSRTGISDIGGICTIYLPDVIAFLFTTNEGSLNGCLDVINRARISRSKLPYDRNTLTAIPIPSRDESRTEFESSQRWRGIFSAKLEMLYADWLPKDIPTTSAIDLLKIPYIPYWSFGDRLPVLEEGTSESSIGYSYERLALLIANDFNWTKVKLGLTSDDVENIISKREKTTEPQIDKVMEIDKYIQERVDSQIQWYSVNSSRLRMIYQLLIMTQISLGASLTVITKFYADPQLMVSIIGAFIIVLTGVQAITDYKGKSILYRKAAEKLKQEKFRYFTSSSDVRKDISSEFVERIEKIISSEGEEWSRIAVKEKSREM